MNTLNLLGSVIAVVVAGGTWRIQRRLVLLERRDRAYQQQQTYSKAYADRKTDYSLYNVVDSMVINDGAFNHSNVSRRAFKAMEFSQESTAKMDVAVKQWLQQAATIVVLAQGKDACGLRAFMQTFHLSVIREASIIEPVLVARAAQGMWSDWEHLIEGLALHDLAREYNSLAPQQRQPVYIQNLKIEDPENEGQNVTRPYVILAPPDVPRRFFLGVKDRTFRALRLRKRHITNSSERIMMAIHQTAQIMHDST